MSPTVHSLEGLCFQSTSARASPALPADTGSPATPFRCQWTAEISRLASVCNRKAVRLRAPASHQMRRMNSLSSPTHPNRAGPLPHPLQLYPGSGLSALAPPSSPPLPWASGVVGAQCAAHAAGGGVSPRPAAPGPRTPALEGTGKRPAQPRLARCPRAGRRRGEGSSGACATFSPPTPRPRDPWRRPRGCGTGRTGIGGEGPQGPGGRVQESGPAHPGLSPPPGTAADGAPAGRGCMGLPRVPVFWLLLLFAVVCSGILVALYSSAVESYPGPLTGAR